MTQSVAIVDYGSGNLRSASKALARAAAEAELDVAVVVTAKADDVARADRVVLPGVGAFGAAMAALEGMDGMIEALEHAVLISKRPFLGICVGMQLLAESGFEFGQTDGLGWIAGTVRKIDGEKLGLRVPQIGWNTVVATSVPPLPALSRTRDYYFVHSYHFEVEHAQHVLATADYGSPLAGVVGRDNILGVQFHPEKSQGAGIELLADFLRWRP